MVTTRSTPMTFLGWVSQLARDHTSRLAAVATREGLSRTDALDAVQEAFTTFLGLPQARSLAGEREDAERLMAVLVRNAARNMRRRRFRSAHHTDIDEDASKLPSDSPSTDAILELAEQHVLLLGCVNRLGEIQRQVVTMRMLEEVAAETTAHAMSLTAGHVAVLLHRAKRSLLECMDDPDRTSLDGTAG